MASELRQQILDNRLAPGDKLPSESELERRFGVSRITVRHALDTLRAGGLITKVNGKGSFVTQASDAARLGPLTGFYDHMRARGHAAFGRLISVRQVPADALQAQALALPQGSPLTVVTMLRLVDDKPVAIGVSCAPPQLMQALLREDLEANDTMTLLESRLGYRLRCTHIETSALRAGKARARRLGITPDAPVLRIRFTPHDVSDRPLVYSEMFFRGDAFSYKAVVKR
jgi:GntR family transcriptional regulator